MIAFGTGKKVWCLAAHEIRQALWSTQSRALPMLFHSFPGCDTVSAFAAKRKKNYMDYLESVSEDNRAIQWTVSQHCHNWCREWCCHTEIVCFLIWQNKQARKHRGREHSRMNSCLRQKHPSKSTPNEQCIKVAVYGPIHVPPDETAQPWHLQRFGVEQIQTRMETKIGSAHWSMISKACRGLIKCVCKKDCDPGCRCRYHLVINTMPSSSTARGTVILAGCYDGMHYILRIYTCMDAWVSTKYRLLNKCNTLMMVGGELCLPQWPHNQVGAARRSWWKLQLCCSIVNCELWSPCSILHK